MASWIDDEGKIHRDTPPPTGSYIDDAGRIHRNPPTTTRTPIYTPPTTRGVSGRIIAGCIFAVLDLIALIIGLSYSGIRGFGDIISLFTELPNIYFWGYGWVCWIAWGLAVIIPAIAIIGDGEDLKSGIWVFLSASIQNIIGVLCAYMISVLAIPIISGFSFPSTSEVGMGMTIFNPGNVLQHIGYYAPQIVIVATLLSSFIFIIVRYNDEYEYPPTNILWSFFCSIIVSIGVLVAISIVILAVWVILALLIGVLLAIAVLIALFCYCCGGC
ncbi:MAG: hypothetical protein LBM93_03445 [Oscillospiraceae bacterium]|nr:hypothetical protein [Oscillospiraceae bacterium]